MSGRQIYQLGYKPQFSGHETFPLRYGWLKKAYDRIAATQAAADNRTACWSEDAIARFGVGKNMVASIRHWAKSTRIVEEPAGTHSVRTTELGEFLLGENGHDPFMEHPSTLWLIHWQLAAQEEKTTWYWAFSHYPSVTFHRDDLIKKIKRFVARNFKKQFADTTIRNDVLCFLRTYVARPSTKKSGHDEALESPLTELGLIKAVGKKDGFRFVRGPKSTLGDGVFVYALLDYWKRLPRGTSLSFESIAHAPGSPGRVFQFDENDVADRLTKLDDVTDGALRWSETAGLRQVVSAINVAKQPPLAWAHRDYQQGLYQEKAKCH